MNKAIAENIAIIGEHQECLEKEISKLSSNIEKISGGLLTLCAAQGFWRIQLYHNRDEGTVDDAVRVVRGLADDGALELNWESDSAKCYYFSINRHPFCIVVDKED